MTGGTYYIILKGTNSVVNHSIVLTFGITIAIHVSNILSSLISIDILIHREVWRHFGDGGYFGDHLGIWLSITML